MLLEAVLRKHKESAKEHTHRKREHAALAPIASALSASAAAQGHVANLVEEHRSLQRIELCDVWSDLG
jgi:hypothetical protein